MSAVFPCALPASALRAVAALILFQLVPAPAWRIQAQAAEPGLPAFARQLIVAVAEGWDSPRAVLTCWERSRARDPWRPVLFKETVPVLLGSGGMAWGLGVATSNDPSARFKKEGDQRAPAGCFQIGRVFGYAAAAPEGCAVPYRQVTRWDAWIDDADHPLYNRHYVAHPSVVPDWFEKHRMRLGDFAYEWMIEIRHNADPPRPGFGSAIFFHIRRGPNRPSHGCTTMRKEDLLSLIRWIDARKSPHYVLLPRETYRHRVEPWSLPSLPAED
ncbi:MAG TPA: L,D-transpeptidase family protein [Verrucomicrobiales bacterium]|nr:L,D-transpeptidase family protein [Verrucomicrobiales bacterium]